MWNHYLVKVRVRCGEHEKITTHLVFETSEVGAMEAGITLEMHDELEWETETSAYDVDRKFYYEAVSARKVEPEHVGVLGMYHVGVESL